MSGVKYLQEQSEYAKAKAQRKWPDDLSATSIYCKALKSSPNNSGIFLGNALREIARNPLTYYPNSGDGGRYAGVYLYDGYESDFQTDLQDRQALLSHDVLTLVK